MKKFILILFMFSFFTKVAADNNNAYSYEFTSIEGMIKLSDYKDKVIIVVNVASRWDIRPNIKIFKNLVEI